VTAGVFVAVNYIMRTKKIDLHNVLGAVTRVKSRNKTRTAANSPVRGDIEERAPLSANPKIRNGFYNDGDDVEQGDEE